MALQRNLKALGTFGYMTATRGNPVYIQYIPRTLRYARTNLLKYDAVRAAARAAGARTCRNCGSGARAGGLGTRLGRSGTGPEAWPASARA